MSHLFTIGLKYAECKSTSMIETLLEQGFIESDAMQHEYAIEAIHNLKSYDTKLEWYFATDETGSPDFDITYQLPKEINKGRLKAILDIILKYQNITTVGIFMYDLGTRHSKTYDDLILEDIKGTLTSWYEFGGPETTVYHLFKRK